MDGFDDRIGDEDLVGDFVAEEVGRSCFHGFPLGHDQLSGYFVIR